MLKRRVIPVFLLRGERLVKGCRFQDYQDTGNPRSTMRVYAAQDSDELMLLDIDRSETSSRLREILEDVADECDMPLSVGGNVTSPKDVQRMLAAGADKVVMTSAGLMAPANIQHAVKEFGSQCVVGAVEYRNFLNGARVSSRGGTMDTGIEVKRHVESLVGLGVGEILLNCVDRDGTRSGFDVTLVSEISDSCPVPIIACGGAGNFQHLVDLFHSSSVSGAACATLFHLSDNSPIRARSYLRNHGIPMRTLK